MRFPNSEALTDRGVEVEHVHGVRRHSGGRQSVRRHRPQTEDELWADETVQHCGTHSILEVRWVVTELEDAGYGTASESEALEQPGVTQPTRAHVKALGPLAQPRLPGGFLELRGSGIRSCRRAYAPAIQSGRTA